MSFMEPGPNHRGTVHLDYDVPYDLRGTDAEGLTGDGQTMLEEAKVRFVLGEIDRSEWESVVHEYRMIEGDLLSRVWTAQFREHRGN